MLAVYLPHAEPSHKRIGGLGHSTYTSIVPACGADFLPLSMVVLLEKYNEEPMARACRLGGAFSLVDPEGKVWWSDVFWLFFCLGGTTIDLSVGREQEPTSHCYTKGNICNFSKSKLKAKRYNQRRIWRPRIHSNRQSRAEARSSLRLWLETGHVGSFASASRAPFSFSQLSSIPSCHISPNLRGAL